MDRDKAAISFFIVVWVVSALASLGLAGVIIWAIVRAVIKYL